MGNKTELITNNHDTSSNVTHNISKESTLRITRIYLKITRHKHHLLNFSFYKENNYIPASLYPRLPPLYMNAKFYRRWRYISHSTAYRHLKLLITTPNADTRSRHFLRNILITWNSCVTPAHRNNFLFTQTNWIPWLYRLSLCLPTDVLKRPLPSAV